MSLIKKLQNSELKRTFKGCKLLLVPMKKEIDEALSNGYTLKQIHQLMKDEYDFPYSYAQFTRSYNEISNFDKKEEQLKEKETTIINKNIQETKPDKPDEKKSNKATWIPDHLKENHKKSEKPENDDKWITVKS